ncbi:zonular occludens toxin domain-containing protein [Chromobacterium sp. IIBBL 290-4]|uniref:zonular occludens toxin domain-containing protein n=1 Tax=Chromobacterium sp. IIBBL 290-4 TaxID=2953890 RepID=UPI0020B7047F|nr:zonular occludens toxin domain-containing protein [Chromobacterium sp. IIBBL 290-4]UTH73575.1 zonular occludens toxin domain-containing protein [Chromobacterium sp. IIBBL 290-4]
MITLLTATPGSGKTLFILQHLDELSKREGRQVYYHNIPLTEEGKKHLGWIELEDPLKWFELPAQALIVMDEAQYVFPVRLSGKQIPAYVDKFATHRHLGLDIFLITQGPRLIDSFIRPLIGRHYHLIRLFGLSRSNLLRWESIQENPNSRGAKADCLARSTFSFPKHVYNWYKSAEAHTVKVSIPKKVWLIGLALVIAVVMVPVSLYTLSSFGKNQVKGSAASAPAGQIAGGSGGQGGKSSAPLTPVQYASERIPRMPGVPDSAPLYDDLAKPRDFPHLAGCMASASRCVCVTQQGTVISDMPDGTCRQYVDRSQFDPYQDPQDLQRRDVDFRQPAPQPAQPVQVTQQYQSARISSLSDATAYPTRSPSMVSDFGKGTHK